MNKFVKEYFEKLDEASKIADKAKIYILDNWEKIKDWSELTIYINNNCGDSPNTKEHEYYSPGGIDLDVLDILGGDVKNIEKKPVVEPNPIKTFDVISDEIDGDMSVTINGEQWWFIDDEVICFIAAYIEKQLDLLNKEDKE